MFAKPAAHVAGSTLLYRPLNAGFDAYSAGQLAGRSVDGGIVQQTAFFVSNPLPHEDHCAMKPTRVPTILCISLGSLMVAVAARAATYNVGSDTACTTTSLQSAINSAANSPGPDLIRVANNQTYTAQALTIDSQDLIIEGGYADCTAAAPTGSTLLSGQGGAAASVLRITGSGVRDLRRLGIIRGDASLLDGEGGGIQFAGSGELILRDVAINQNTAAYGGGINFRATAIPAVLTLESGTTVSFNTAQISGGGIRIEGYPARLFMLRSQTAVFSNIARGIDLVSGLPQGGYGGGILALDAARVDIASTGYGGIAAIQDNEAQYGGGLAVVGNTISPPTLRLFRVDPAVPPTVRGNRANLTGGGIYLRPVDEGLTFEPNACLFGAYLEDNIAQNGAAAYVDGDSGGLFVFPYGASLLVRRQPASNSQMQICGIEAPANLGGVVCAPGAPCNLMRGNRAQTLAGTPTDGAIVLAQTESQLSLGDTAMIGNTAHNLIRSFSDFALSPPALSNCLLADNAVSGSLLRYSESARLDLIDCTIAGNAIGGNHVVQADNANGGSLTRTIIWQPGKSILSYPGGGANANISVSRSLVSDRTTLPDGPEYLGGEPRFNDPASGDWRLRISSAAVDGAMPVVGDDRDLSGNPRDQVIYPAPIQTVRDAGAYERPQNAPLLVNGSFDGSLSAWSVRSSPYVTYDALNNDGADGSGSVLVSVPIEVAASLSEVEVLSQCFNVPFPGVYSLSARASANGTTQTRDVPKLYWRLRDNSADCSGSVSAQGVSFFPGVGSSFINATASEISVPSANFGPGTSIEVLMAVAHNAIAIGSLQARFDNPELRILSGPLQPYPVFADGFE